MLTDEVVLGKTIEAALFLGQLWAERRLLVICPAALRKQWAQELSEIEPSTGAERQILPARA
ncbi:ATP-dependent helicase HepA [compost metagenome]